MENLNSKDSKHITKQLSNLIKMKHQILYIYIYHHIHRNYWKKKGLRISKVVFIYEEIVELLKKWNCNFVHMCILIMMWLFNCFLYFSVHPMMYCSKRTQTVHEKQPFCSLLLFAQILHFVSHHPKPFLKTLFSWTFLPYPSTLYLRAGCTLIYFCSEHSCEGSRFSRELHMKQFFFFLSLPFSLSTASAANYIDVLWVTTYFNLASDQAHFTTNVYAGILREKIIHHCILRNCWNQIKFAQNEQNIWLCKNHHFSCSTEFKP